jgi:hypothetical protein
MSVKRIFLFFMVSMVVVPSVWAASPDMSDISKIDGHVWMSWPEHTRVIVLYGVVCGMNMAVSSIKKSNDTDVALNVHKIELNKNKEHECFVEFKNLDRHLIDNVRIDQLLYGLDQMYADISTRNILLSDAILFVRNWIHGASADEFNGPLRYLKEGSKAQAVEHLVVRGSDGRVNKIIKFP